MKAVCPRLTFAPYDARDCLVVRALLQNPAVMRYIGDGPMSPESAAAWVAQRIQTGPQNGLGWFAVRERVLGEFVGHCCVQSCEFSDALEIAYALEPRYWGTGLADDLINLLRRHAAAIDAHRRVCALVRIQNIRSAALLGRTGFRFMRELRSGARHLLYFEAEEL